MRAILIAFGLLSTAATAEDLRFARACDGSAAAALPDGRIVVAYDEDSVLRVYAPDGGSQPIERGLGSHLDLKDDDESDIEAAARVGARIYWIGSHGRNTAGKERPKRKRFFATDATADLNPVGVARTDLLDLMARDPGLKGLGPAALAATSVPPDKGGINIEALADDGKGGLLIGFRSPPAPGTARALIVPLLDAAALVDKPGSVPRFGAPITLDLGGLGLRDMIRRADGSYVLVAGRIEDAEEFALFTWSGAAADTPRRIATAPDRLASLNPEAIVELGGRLLVLSDDGTDPCKAAAPAQKTFRGRWLP